MLHPVLLFSPLQLHPAGRRLLGLQGWGVNRKCRVGWLEQRGNGERISVSGGRPSLCANLRMSDARCLMNQHTPSLSSERGKSQGELKFGICICTLSIYIKHLYVSMHFMFYLFFGILIGDLWLYDRLDICGMKIYSYYGSL